MVLAVLKGAESDAHADAVRLLEKKARSVLIALLRDPREFDKGVRTPHIAFNLLEYVLWKEGDGLPDAARTTSFIETGSIEHFSPQTPFSGENPGNIDSFGNLALITQSLNSQLGNRTPHDKIEYLGGRSLDEIGSLKYRIMMDKASSGWSEAEIKAHEEDMLGRLRRWASEEQG